MIDDNASRDDAVRNLGMKIGQREAVSCVVRGERRQTGQHRTGGRRTEDFDIGRVLSLDPVSVVITG